MSLPEKLRTLRHKKHWTQKELADLIKTDKYNISRYECGMTVPSLEMIKKLADAFYVSIDYLVYEDYKEGEIKDPELLRYFEKIEKISEEDKETIKRVMKTMIEKAKMEGML